MTLLEELKERRDRQEEVLDEVAEAIKEREEYRLRVEQVLDDLDLAIAALQPGEIEITVTNDEPDLPTPIVNTDEGWELEPSPAELFAAEKSEAREQLEREDDASEFAEPMPDPEFVVLDEQTCEPVEEAPALNADMQDEREQPVTDVAALIASGEHSYDEVAAIAYPEPAQIAQGSIADVAQPEWNGPTLPGGYAPVTSPEADEAAKAHEYYDPKAVAERDRNAGMARLFSYNPFYKPKVDA